MYLKCPEDHVNGISFVPKTSKKEEEELDRESMEETSVSLRLLIDTKSRRVLFAEAGKEFIDFLFHILALPVGTIISLLKMQGTVGSFKKIYESFENLGTTYLQPNVNKGTLLKPKVHTSGGTGVALLLPNIVSSLTSRKLYGCAPRSYSSPCQEYVADDSRAICPYCEGSNYMSRELKFVDAPSATNKGSTEGEGGYVKGVITYMVMDDLEVKPMSIISIFTLLNNFNIKEIGVLEEKVVNLRMDEGLKLLKASMQSKSVLTDVFLPMLKLEVKCKNDCVRSNDEDKGEGVEVEDEGKGKGTRPFRNIQQPQVKKVAKIGQGGVEDDDDDNYFDGQEGE